MSIIINSVFSSNFRFGVRFLIVLLLKNYVIYHISNCLNQQILKSLTNTKFVLSCIDFFKTKLLRLSFSGISTYLTLLLWASTVSIFCCFYFALLMVLILIVEWFASTIHSDNLGEDFWVAKKLEWSSALRSTYPKFFNRYKTFLFYGIKFCGRTFCCIYGCVTETRFFNSFSFI